MISNLNNAGLLFIVCCGLGMGTSSAQVPGRFMEKDKWGFKDSSGNVLIKPKYESAFYFHDGMCRVEKNKKYGYVDSTGVERIALQYDAAGNFSEGLTDVSLNKRYGFINRSGNTVIPFEFDYAFSFQEGLAGVRKAGLYGFIDRKGSLVIEHRFEEANSFSEGLAVVELNGKYGFIDKQGKFAIEPKYDAAEDMKNGAARVGIGSYSDRKWGYVSTNGQAIGDIKFDKVQDFKGDSAEVVLKGNKDYMYRSGQTSKEWRTQKNNEAKHLADQQASAEALAKRDEDALRVLELFRQRDQELFNKVNALNEFLKHSMITNDKDFNRSNWFDVSRLLHSDYCPAARAELNNYIAAAKAFESLKEKNELYDRIVDYHAKVDAYINGCLGWADLIHDKTVDIESINAQLGYLEPAARSMASAERAIQSFLPLYKSRNGIK
ncbi:MAG: WG repeat-containing protein [Flavobacteriales bacterium]|nr:WG repeat-containing protein [Flavobacteriales bacterium]